MLDKVLATVFKFFADEADAVQPSSHRKFRIVDALSARLCSYALSGQRLVVDRQGQYYVGTHFARVELAIEASQLHGAFPTAVEETVEVKHVVTAVVIMAIATITVTFIPNIFQTV